jgi:hypothetical protein
MDRANLRDPTRQGFITLAKNLIHSVKGRTDLFGFLSQLGR